VQDVCRCPGQGWQADRKERIAAAFRGNANLAAQARDCPADRGYSATASFVSRQAFSGESRSEYQAYQARFVAFPQGGFG
jgi:hypothetical protein